MYIYTSNITHPPTHPPTHTRTHTHLARRDRRRSRCHNDPEYQWRVAVCWRNQRSRRRLSRWRLLASQDLAAPLLLQTNIASALWSVLAVYWPNNGAPAPTVTRYEHIGYTVANTPAIANTREPPGTRGRRSVEKHQTDASGKSGGAGLRRHGSASASLYTHARSRKFSFAHRAL